MADPFYFELLQWHPAAGPKPDTDITVAVWSAADALLTAYWDSVLCQWIDCASGGEIDDVTHWADPLGPVPQAEAIAPADVPVDQVRAALSEALELLRGWVDHKCPRKHQAEHLAVIDVLAAAGGLS